MRRAVLIGLAIFVTAGVAGAGVYIPSAGPPSLPPCPPDAILGTVLRLRAVPIAKDKPPEERTRLLRRTAALEEAKESGVFSTLDRVDLSGCYLRLNQPQKALRLLTDGDQEHFLVQSNLAAAYFLTGHPDRAASHQERALALWPVVCAGWTDQQLSFARECERCLLRLYRCRENESRAGERQPLDLDPIFPGFRFVGPNGTYEPGALSWEMRDRLPANASWIVVQLAVWFPADPRLFWYLGEMLALGGEFEQASRAFQLLSDEGALRRFRDAFRHRQAVNEAHRAMRVLERPGEEEKAAAARAQLLVVLLSLSRCPPGAPLADAALLAGDGALTVLLPLWAKPHTAAEQQPAAAAAPPPPAVWPFNPAHIAVSFGFGFLAALLLAFQWRQWRRRPARAAEPPAHVAAADVRGDHHPA